MHRALPVLLLAAVGCARPPVLTPVRVADRSIAPLARTAELRISPSVVFERRPRSGEESARLRLESHDIALRPNMFLTVGLSDAFAMLIPLGVFASPVFDPDRGRFVTLGGGLYGFQLGSEATNVTDGLGVWAKDRFGESWLLGGVALFHVFNSRLYDGKRRSLHELSLIGGLESGTQLAQAWALMLSTDYDQLLLGRGLPYARVRAELAWVPAWWIDLGADAGFYVHPRDRPHADPLLGLTLALRW